MGEQEKKKEEEAASKKKMREKKKQRGKNKVGKRLKRKHRKEGDEQRKKTKARLNGMDSSALQVADSNAEDDGEEGGEEDDIPKPNADAQRKGKKQIAGAALSRFYGKRR